MTKLPVLEEPRLQMHTRFGDFDVDARDVIQFPVGLPGFEQCRRFVLLSSPSLSPIQCLHAVGDPPASFLVLDPRLVVADYACGATAADRGRLQAAEDDVLLWLALLTIDADAVMSANLRAPVVINPTRMVGYQVIPEHSLYPLRYRLTVD